MKKNKRILIFSIITALVIIFGALFGIHLAKKSLNSEKDYAKTPVETGMSRDKMIDALSDIEKTIAGLNTGEDEEIEEEENYSDLYKEYLELPEEEKEKLEVIPREEDVPFEKLDEIKDLLDEDTIPERFNLAEKIDIQVENQGSYGLCWDFASIKTLETHLALNNLGNYDFSELHLDYITSNLMYGYRQIHSGGNFSNFEDYIIESGVVLEEQLPYSYNEYSKEEYEKFDNMPIVIEVTETVNFPSIYKYEDSEYTEEQLEEFRQTVKRHIMKNGGLYTSIVGTAATNHYTSVYDYDWMNHAVTIVGWDDNYSKDNFMSMSGKKPEKDGAYIALNSWGEDFNNKGYYYISYEDKYVETNLSGIASTTIDSAYKINSISNPVIKKYLKENYEHLFIEYNGEEYITKHALSTIRSIRIENSDNLSLDGFEIFSNLNYLYLPNNNIKDLTPITELTSLNYIDLSNNSITDISALGNMKSKNISSINLANNNISDISAIVNLEQLTSINLSNNNIVDVSAFANSGIKSLYNLNLSNNKIKDISPIQYQKNEDEWAFLELNISNNKNVKGYETLKNVTLLDMSDCNITDFADFKATEALRALIVANNPGIDLVDKLPNSLQRLEVSSCELDEIPNIVEDITYLDISKNNITTLEGIQNYRYLSNLNVSENPITDWSALKEIQVQVYESYEEYYYDEYYGEARISITAKNCNIEDITIFNNIDQLTSLDLEGNKIHDVSQFNNDTIYYIDLSNNENITGLESLKNANIVFLNDCNIEDIAEILKLKNVCSLSLENNDLKDITAISQLSQLTSVSLAGNKNIKGNITNSQLYNLNLSNCSLDDDIDFSGMPNLSYVNISGNPGIKQRSNILKSLKNMYVTVILDEIDIDEFEESKLNDQHFYIENAIVQVNYDLPENEKEMNLSQKELLEKEIRGNVSRGAIKVENGSLKEKGQVIIVDDVNKNFVEVICEGWGLDFHNSIIKIQFGDDLEDEGTGIDTTSNEAEGNNINTIIDDGENTNTVVNNTIY